MKIVIRFLTLNNSNINVVIALSTIQFQLNNSLNASIYFSSNEIIYKFRMHDTILTFNQKLQNELNTNKRENNQTKTNDAIAFVNAKIKIYYDFKHKSLFLKSKNKIYFRFNKNYRFSNHHKKLLQQRCESFIVNRKIKRLTYELKLSSI